MPNSANLFVAAGVPGGNIRKLSVLMEATVMNGIIKSISVALVLATAAI